MSRGAVCPFAHVHSSAGQLDHWPWIVVAQFGTGSSSIRSISPALCNLASSEDQASHAFLIDHRTGDAWVAPMAIARLVVRTQQVEVLIDN